MAHEDSVELAIQHRQRAMLYRARPDLGFRLPFRCGPVPAQILSESESAGNPSLERWQGKSSADQSARASRARTANDIV